jgi:hypothetical protein
VGEKTTGIAGSVFDQGGAIGKQFTSTSPAIASTFKARMLTLCRKASGAIGGTAQKIGGPLDAQGSIGKQFTTEGSIGGAVQNALGGSEKSTVQDKQ